MRHISIHPPNGRSFGKSPFPDSTSNYYCITLTSYQSFKIFDIIFSLTGGGPVLLPKCIPFTPIELDCDF